MITDSRPGEDKKALTAMLSKLYITANSSLEKLRMVNELTTEAIDSKIASETASKTALNKLYLAVGKALMEASSGKEVAIKETVEPAAAPDKVMIETTKVDGFVEETGGAEEVAMTERVYDDEQAKEDSMLDELLDEESET